MKICFLFSVALFYFSSLHGQAGCTDPAASNYNATATTNDGSCIYPATNNSPLLRAYFPTSLSSSSGVVWTDGKLWTHNDSGNPAAIYQVDTNTGTIIKTVHVDNATNTDWEDITADSAYIYVGNFGNNNGDRTDLNILKIKKADITSGTSVHVNAQTINFYYADQTSFTSNSTTNFDCEALISIGDSLFMFSKDRGDMQTRVYKLPKTPGTYHISPFTSFHTNGMITGADYDPTTHEIALIGYMTGHLHSFIWILSDYQGSLFFSGNKRRIEIGSAQQWQTEGITYIGDNRFFISCETAGTINASLYTTAETWQPVQTSISETNTKASINIYPNPAMDVLHIDMKTTGHFILSDLLGKKIIDGTLEAGNNDLQIAFLPRGVYTIEIVELNSYRYLTRIEK